MLGGVVLLRCDWDLACGGSGLNLPPWEPLLHAWFGRARPGVCLVCRERLVAAAASRVERVAVQLALLPAALPNPTGKMDLWQAVLEVQAY